MLVSLPCIDHRCCCHDCRFYGTVPVFAATVVCDSVAVLVTTFVTIVVAVVIIAISVIVILMLLLLLLPWLVLLLLILALTVAVVVDVDVVTVVIVVIVVIPSVNAAKNSCCNDSSRSKDKVQKLHHQQQTRQQQW